MDYFITDQPGKRVTAGAQLAFGIIVVICLILILGLQMGLLSRMKSEGMDVQRYVGAGLVPNNFSQVLSSGATLRNEGAVMSQSGQGTQDIGLATYNQYADMSRRAKIDAAITEAITATREGPISYAGIGPDNSSSLGSDMLQPDVEQYNRANQLSRLVGAEHMTMAQFKNGNAKVASQQMARSQGYL